MSHVDIVPNWALTQIEQARKPSAKTLNLNGYRRIQKLTKIPREVFELTHLKELDLHDNQLTAVPDAISRLRNLKILNLSYNRLTAVSDALAKLHHLQTIDLRHNRLMTVPDWLVKLLQLNALYLHNNPIHDPPPGIINLQGSWGRADIRKLRAYFRQLAEGEDVLYEAKLIIIGEGMAGKTTLAKKLLNPNYELRNEDATVGIQIFHWEFPWSQEELPNGQAKEVTFRVNIWDFGGQEIDHATHRFFITKDSLYIIVADTRPQKTDFHYWLHIVGLFSSQSPTLIVKNETGDRPWDIREQQLRAQFRHFERVYSVNLATQDERLQLLTNQIKYQIANLPLVGKRLPKTWIQVRQALEDDPRNTMPLQDYLDICERCGFKRKEDKLQLSDYLTKIGVCLHFPENVALREILFLKPEWATEAAYKALNDKIIRDKYGRFNQDDLDRIWDEKHNELLQLMMLFQLCYPLRDTNDYILPQLLKNEPPQTTPDNWNENNSLILRYEYPNFMPKGILTRFIVATHKYIAEQDMVWKTGVVLEIDKAYAKVIEYYEQRKIEILVMGPSKRDLLTIVNWELKQIHKTFPDLLYNMHVPCNCDQCNDHQDPHFFKFKELKARAEFGKDYIECGKRPFHTVKIRDLIEGLGIKHQILPDDEDGFEFDRAGLVNKLVKHFSLDELHMLSLELNIDYEELSGQTIISKAQALVSHCQRRGRVGALMEIIKDHRPFLGN